jgi:hypothetical protein
MSAVLLRRFACALAVCLAVLLGASSSWAQMQRTKIVGPDVEAVDNFGYAVAIDGDWVLIGSPLDDDIAEQSGAVYVYRRNGSTWTFAQKLKASDPFFGAQYGAAVAIEGSLAVVGADLDHPSGINNAGSAYVLERVNDTWFQRAKLWAGDAQPNSSFGEAVDISGGTIVIGSWRATGVAWLSGLAYVFEGAGSTWIETARLLPHDAGQGDGFGCSVAVDGDRLVVGASGWHQPPAASIGAAYVFEKQISGAWTQAQKLSPPGSMNDYFGFDVDMQGDWVMTGADGANVTGPNSGVVYAFQFSSGAWRLSQAFVGLDTTTGDQFGAWLAMDGGVALVSGHQADDYASNSGGGYAFSLQGSNWVQEGKLLPEDSYPSHLVGIELALSGRTAVLGARFDNSACPDVAFCQSGAAYIFDLPTNVTQYGSCASNAPCGNLDTHGGCRNWTGHGAVLQARGNTSYAADDLVLQVRDLPPNGYQRLFMGPLQMSAPFGNGQRVVAPGALGYFRYPVQQANALGYSSFGPGIIAHSQGYSALGQIAPGQTWHFQSWYRDIANACGNLYNLSNGVSVTFVP